MGVFSRLMQKKRRCHKCGRTVYAPRLRPATTIAGGNDQRIWQNDLALECTSCKKETCNTCAREAGRAIGEDKPICPSCNGPVR
ncbi:MAG: hypothetical protein HQ592_10955 [Planctomycetes bacterium]|nr:hypothetical protein [Planctomycetota bacterium]